MTKNALSILGCALLLSVSCKMVSRVADSASDLFGDEVVARVGEHRLHRSALENYIPNGVSAEDSAGLAQQYINTWAEELLFLDMAEAQLSREEKDVSRELEDYRRSLLRYRYEQSFINERLDTLISEEEIRTYYADHADKFVLERPIVKVRYMIIPADSRNLKVIRKKMSSDDPAETLEADSLAFTSALKYVDSSDSWMDAMILARELGTDYESLLAAMKGDTVELPDGNGNLRFAYIVTRLKAGQTAPLDYCEDRIRDLILSARKHALLSGLERDLLDEARRNDTFVIY